MAPRELPVAFLVSGEGTTLEGIADLVHGAHLPVRIVLVVSDRPHATAIEKARRHGLRTLVLPFRGMLPDSWSEELTGQLENHGVELVVLAGFLSVLPAPFVRRWEGRILNLHPSLLPKFGGPGLYGAKVHRAVIEAGEKESGATVHLVTEEVDRGPILAQVRVELVEGETPESLRRRLHPHEVMLLGETLRRIAEGAIPLPVPRTDIPPPDPAAGENG